MRTVHRSGLQFCGVDVVGGGWFGIDTPLVYPTPGYLSWVYPTPRYPTRLIPYPFPDTLPPGYPTSPWKGPSTRDNLPTLRGNLGPEIPYALWSDRHL